MMKKAIVLVVAAVALYAASESFAWFKRSQLDDAKLCRDVASGGLVACSSLNPKS
ncbi:hypothetical protein [Serratia ficaria]|uniref:hypothetical protein n=1 Tax=Serratia ficaria TaxID=61651 RepID=UPI000B09DC3C|nr:hypothetical protein [Serratia ficaria]CAI1998880.1 Uncharacterised protein [Serratia ficaria]VVA50893.1 hypothetical protein SERVES_04667 [Serratia ficaria]